MFHSAQELAGAWKFQSSLSPFPGSSEQYRIYFPTNTSFTPRNFNGRKRYISFDCKNYFSFRTYQIGKKITWKSLSLSLWNSK